MAIHFTVYQLRLAMEHQMIASLYTDMNDPDAFCTGYVEQVNARHVLLAALTPWGMRDGWLLWRTADVQQVFCGDEFETRLELLTQLRRQTHLPFASGPENPMETDLLQWLLNQAMATEQTVSLVGPEDTYTGKIAAVDDLRVAIKALDFFGRPMLQPVVLPLRDIQSATVDTEEERMYDLLCAAAKPELLRALRPEGGSTP